MAHHDPSAQIAGSRSLERAEAGTVLALAFALSAVAGCAEVGGAAATPAQAPAAGALDGRLFRVALVAERGGAAETVELSFDHGALDASDMRDQGFLKTVYTVRGERSGIVFEGEARSPSAVRRFRGRVEGDRVSGTMMVVPDGAMPVRYTFAGVRMT